MYHAAMARDIVVRMLARIAIARDECVRRFRYVKTNNTIYILKLNFIERAITSTTPARTGL